MCGVKKTVSKMHKLPSTKYSTWYHYLPLDKLMLFYEEFQCNSQNFLLIKIELLI